MITLFSIDPGESESGWILLDVDTINKKIMIIDRYHSVNKDIFKMILKFSVTNPRIIIVIEDIVSYGLPIGISTIETIKYIGRFHQKALDLNLKNIYFIDRPAIKLSLCNARNAKDGNVIRSLKNRFGEFGTIKNQQPLYKLKGMPSGMLNHVWSALALGVAYININYDEKHEFKLI